MASYKVPQDVEADDKLIGPFSFRQFIYLLIVAAAIALGWGLSRVFLPLAIIPLPVIIFFGALALPLRKDQPMEIYLAAVVSFYIKPRKRLWQPDGLTSLVEVTAPKTLETLRTKGFDENEAERRLSYLAGIVDSQGWAVRGVADQSANSPMNSDIFFAAQQTEDVLDDDNTLSKNFDQMISQADANRRKQMIDKMHETFTPGPQFQDQHFDRPAETPQSQEAPAPFDFTQTADMHYNPYPENIHQRVILPVADQQRLAEEEQERQRQLQAEQQQRQAAATTYQVPVQPQPEQQSYNPPTYQPQVEQPSQPSAPVAQYPQQQYTTPTQAQPTYEPPQETYQPPQPSYSPPQQMPAPVTKPPQTPSAQAPSPDTIDLAINHHDLSVETISREANRLRERQEQAANEDEVVISLR